ncbi:MAG: FemAB, partial [Novosphingobium sp.]|nr:FemAB [Novosphingobium sp.]
MNAPFYLACNRLRLADLADPDEQARIEAFLASHPDGTPFHRPAWLEAVHIGTGNRALALVAEDHAGIRAYLPLNEIHSPIFGRLLASSGFAVGGGLLLREGANAGPILAAAEELALRLSCQTIELRGGFLPPCKGQWTHRADSHCGFVTELAADDDSQLLAIPRKQRAEVRKSLGFELEIEIGTGARDRAAHYAVYAESVRNLGTPVFPRGLFDAVLDRFGKDTDILTVRHRGRPI